MASSTAQIEQKHLFAREAEQSIVAALFGAHGQETFDRLCVKLVATDFFFDHTRVAFNAFAELVERDIKPDSTLLVTQIKSSEHYNDDTKRMLAEAMVVPYSMENIDAYADAILQKAQGRLLQGHLRNALDRTSRIGGDVSITDVLGDVEAVSLLLDQRGNEIELLKSPTELAIAVFERIQSLEDGAMVGVKTGIDELDVKIGGFLPGDYVVIAARPSMGKTAFALKIALTHGIRNVEADPAPLVAIFSLEMEKEKLGMRMLSNLARINHDHIRAPASPVVSGDGKPKSKLTETDWQKLTYASAKVCESSIHVDDDGTLTPGLLRGKLRALQNLTKKKVSLVIIDYLQLMDVDNGSKANNRNEEVTIISRNLKKVAKSFGCPVVVLSQLNRSLENRPNKRPQMSDLRESGAIEQDADTILFLYRDEYYNPDSTDKGIAEVIAAKVRDGTVGAVATIFEGEYQNFENKSYGQGDYATRYPN